MCECDLEKMENHIRSAIANMLIDDQTEAISDLLECLKLIDQYI